MINNILNWVIENCEWLFSGIGVTILFGVIGLVREKSDKDLTRRQSIKIKQKNKGHTDTQIGIQNNYYGGSKDDR